MALLCARGGPQPVTRNLLPPRSHHPIRVTFPSHLSKSSFRVTDPSHRSESPFRVTDPSHRSASRRHRPCACSAKPRPSASVSKRSEVSESSIRVDPSRPDQRVGDGVCGGGGWKERKRARRDGDGAASSRLRRPLPRPPLPGPRDPPPPSPPQERQARLPLRPSALPPPSGQVVEHRDSKPG
jgi:hypothetical protein